MRPALVIAALSLTATLWGCGVTAGDEAVAGAAGLSCAPGDARLADDQCNTCLCDDQGQWQCTALACAQACAPGEQRPALDPCNTCTCTDGGRWACSADACDGAGNGGFEGDVDGGGDGLEADAGGAAPPVDPEPGAADCAPDQVAPGACGGVCLCVAGVWACDGACDGALVDADSEAPDRGGACVEDADCAPAGCDGRQCGALADDGPEACDPDRTVAACYAPEAQVAGCGCVAGRCAWSDYAALAECAAERGDLPAGGSSDGDDEAAADAGPPDPPAPDGGAPDAGPP